jgi:hypothetical protein
MLSGAALDLEIAILQLSIGRARPGKGSKERLPGWRDIQPCRPPRHKPPSAAPATPRRWGRFAFGRLGRDCCNAIADRIAVNFTKANDGHSFLGTDSKERGRQLKKEAAN